MFCSDPSVVVKEKREHPRVCCDLHLGVPTVFLPKSRPNNAAAGTFNLDCIQIPFSHSVPRILKSTQTMWRYQVLLAPSHHTLTEWSDRHLILLLTRLLRTGAGLYRRHDNGSFTRQVQWSITEGSSLIGWSNGNQRRRAIQRNATRTPYQSRRFCIRNCKHFRFWI